MAALVDPGGLEVDRVQMLVEQPQALALDPLAAVAVGLVRELDAQHPKRQRLAVDRRLERRLDRRDLLLMAPRQVPEEALAGEPAELDRRLPQPLHRLEP